MAKQDDKKPTMICKIDYKGYRELLNKTSTTKLEKDIESLYLQFVEIQDHPMIIIPNYLSGIVMYPDGKEIKF